MIVGAGNVGISIAYSLVTHEIVNQVGIYDINTNLALGQVYDLQDASSFFSSTKVSFMDYKDLHDGDIVVIACGKAQNPSQTRIDLLNDNIKIAKSVFNQINQTNKNVYVIVVTNPVDIITYFACKELNLPEGKVFGSGTVLDSARLRYLISEQLNVNPIDVTAFVVGEHGDTSFPVLSNANIGGINIDNFININKEYYREVNEKVRNRAYEIISLKGYTQFGIGVAVSQMIRSIVRNENKIFTLSVPVKGQYNLNDLVISIPVQLNYQGFNYVKDLVFNEEESDMFYRSAIHIKESINSCMCE